MARPRPVPSALEVKKGLKIFPMMPGSIPFPVSLTAGLVRHVATNAEQVSAAADKVGGVENGLILVHDEGDRLARLGEAIVVVVERIDQRRARRGGPL